MSPYDRHRLRGLTIIGTSTDVGKTFVATKILSQLVQPGRSVGVYKPVASGCRREGERLVSDDAVALWGAAGRPGGLEEVCPQRFAAPLAPHLAARCEGLTVDDLWLRRGLEHWRETSDVLIVEGAGGWYTPLSDQTLVADFADEIKFPLVLVVRNQLGAINHALLTAAAITTRTDLNIVTVVLNEVDRELDSSAADNAAEIALRLPQFGVNAPVVSLSYGSSQFEPAVDWWELAQLADLPD